MAPKNKYEERNMTSTYTGFLLSPKIYKLPKQEYLSPEQMTYRLPENSKPTQYQIGIDTFARMEANCSKEEILAFCKGNIDKYTWRTKGCDLEDFKKIIDYANFAIKQLEK